MKSFAADLSGHDLSSEPFTLVTGQQQLKEGERTATQGESEALATCEYSRLFGGGGDMIEAHKEFHRLRNTLGDSCADKFVNLETFQNAVYTWLKTFGPAAFIANQITSSPQKLRDIAGMAFPDSEKSSEALECLLAFMSFAKEKNTNKVFSPARAHLFFRGLSGVYA